MYHTTITRLAVLPTVEPHTGARARHLQAHTLTESSERCPELSEPG